MHAHRRRKKRPNYGIRTVEVNRGANGFGFTISGQQPCILSCIVTNSPADQAGLKAGDFLISVNGLSVSKVTHDAVVKLIGNSVGPIKMSIAEYYYSDSSDDEPPDTMIIRSKPRYPHRSKFHRVHKYDASSVVTANSAASLSAIKHAAKIKAGCVSKKVVRDLQSAIKFDDSYDSSKFPKSMNEKAKESSAMLIDRSSIEYHGYKFVIGYLGTIEMPNQLAPAMRLHTVYNCIRKLRLEKRSPTTVIMTVLPTCIMLTNAEDQNLAMYPAGRIVYISSSAEKDSCYFGLVTTAARNGCRTDSIENRKANFMQNMSNQNDQEFDISNSCHVFMTDSKLTEHSVHSNKAASFNIICSKDIMSDACLEFPRNCEYIINLVQKMYNLTQSAASVKAQIDNQDCVTVGNAKVQEFIGVNDQVLANSPQPSASSNSDSGIGFRDDCGVVSDRILVVDFPAQLPLPVITAPIHRPSAIDGSSLGFDVLEQMSSSQQTTLLNSVNNSKQGCQQYYLESRSNCIYSDKMKSNKEPYADKVKLCSEHSVYENLHKLDRSCGKTESVEYCIYCNRRCFEKQLNVDKTIPVIKNIIDSNVLDNLNEISFQKSPSDASFIIRSKSSDSIFEQSHHVCIDNKHFKKPNDYVKPVNILKSTHDFEKCKNFSTKNNFFKVSEKSDDFDSELYSKSPYVSQKSNLSYEELNTFTSEPHLCGDKFSGFGSLQELCIIGTHLSAISEPDVRYKRDINNDRKITSDEHRDVYVNQLYEDIDKSDNGAACWALGFEKLLEDPKGYEVFSEFLKKEFSAENIHFWTSCERYRKIDCTEDRVCEAKIIYNNHLCKGALEPVNVDSQARNITQDALRLADPHLFVQAQKQIFNLMKFDSYPRFLKSDLYKDCLLNVDTNEIHDENKDSEHRHQSTKNSNKLKKSLSNAEDRRRKSLLPWNRKNRSKSKDRGEMEYTQSNRPPSASQDETSIENAPSHNGKDMYSSKSSLTSWEMSMNHSQDDNKSVGEHSSGTCYNKNNLCRIILSDGATTVVPIRTNETIREMVNRLMDKRGLMYSTYEVYVMSESKPIDISKDCSYLAGHEVKIEQRVMFKLDLPNRKVISVKSKPKKILSDVLRPILHKYGYKLELVKVLDYPQNDKSININIPVTTVDTCRLVIQSIENEGVTNSINLTHKKTQAASTSLDEITNKVFEELLQEKSEKNNETRLRSDQGSLKSEDWGSEHSSGIFGRFLRRDSANTDKRHKKIIVAGGRSKGSSSHGSIEDIGSDSGVRKPLIAKWKAGVKLHVAVSKSSESDELYEGLKRAQRQRLEDQRGTEINFELPDFLKDKEHAEQNSKKVRKLKSNPENVMSELANRFYNTNNETTAANKISQHVQDHDRLDLSEHQQTHLNLIESKFCEEDKLSTVLRSPNKSLQSSSKYLSNDSPSKSSTSSNLSRNGLSSLETTVIENVTIKQCDNNLESDKKELSSMSTSCLSVTESTEPPPLPPKPKVLPIKPSNWKKVPVNAKQLEMYQKKSHYLDQPTSSFV